jgi:hypothetical protein
MTKGTDWLRLRLLQPPAFQLKAPEIGALLLLHA